MMQPERLGLRCAAPRCGVARALRGAPSETMKLHAIPVLLLCLTSLPAQEPPRDTPRPAESASPAAQGQDGDTWSQGFGRAPSYRGALAAALEDAVAKVKGIQIARGPSVRSRLAVVSDHQGGEQQGWFDGEAELEREWVQQQIAGFVLQHEVVEKGRADDDMWEVTVRALVAGLDRTETAIVVELQDNDLTRWTLERFEEEGPGRPFDRKTGNFEGPKIGEYTRRSGAVKLVSSGGGVTVRAGRAAREREKAGNEVVASHKIAIEWQPLVVQSLVEKPNRARPTAGPRPEYMSGGAVTVSVRIEDLVERTVLLEETFTVPGEGAAAFPAERRDAFITRLVDRAKAIVATRIFFTLRPPVVLRKWAGEGGAWFVEASIARAIASGFDAFSVGNDGSLTDPDWQPLADARLVGGSAQSCTFELAGVVDPARIEPGQSQVRPVQ